MSQRIATSTLVDQKVDEIMTAYEAARLLKVNEKTVRKMASTGKLPCFKVGAQFRFVKSELLALGKGGA